MRKRRVIIFNKDARLRNEVTRFFAARGYETVVFRDPSICPVYGEFEDCKGSHSCGDIMLLEFETPIMNGVDLIAAQHRRGCKLPATNKAIITASLPAEGRATLASVGAEFFQTPLVLSELEKWVAECETRMDLGRPVAVRRKEERQEVTERMSFYLVGNRIGRAMVVNKSTCGVCFMTSHRLTPNEMITLHAESRGTTDDAVVRWVKAAGKGIFLVGISYCI